MFDFTHKYINAMVRFHGISTKYLENYLGWMRMLNRESDITSKPEFDNLQTNKSPLESVFAVSFKI